MAAARLKQKSGRLFGLRNTTFPCSGQIGIGPSRCRAGDRVNPEYGVVAVPEQFFACGLKNAMQVL